MFRTAIQNLVMCSGSQCRIWLCVQGHNAEFDYEFRPTMQNLVMCSRSQCKIWLCVQGHNAEFGAANEKSAQNHWPQCRTIKTSDKLAAPFFKGKVRQKSVPVWNDQLPLLEETIQSQSRSSLGIGISELCLVLNLKNIKNLVLLPL